MWYPPLLVPFSPETEPLKSSNITHAAAAMIWQMIPFDQRMLHATNEFVAPSLSIGDSRKFLLNRSVFDLVRATHFLELTDPKLLCWYLSLPVEDRTLIQEEGGFLQFLQRHPALEVARQLVYVKQQLRGNYPPPQPTDMSSKLNKSRRPTFYGVSHCQNCGTSFPSGAKKCRRCNALILKPEGNGCLSEEEKKLGFLPNNVKEELNLLDATGNVSPCVLQHQGSSHRSRRKSTVPQLTPQDSFQSACDCSHIAEPPPALQGAQSSQAQLLSQLWEEGVWGDGTSVTIFKDPSAQASFSLDTELDVRSGTTRRSVCDPALRGRGVPGPFEDRADFPVLEREAPPEYYSFNSTRLDCTSAEWGDPRQSAEPDRNDSLVATRGGAELSLVEEPPESGMASSRVGRRTFTDSTSCHSNSSEWTDNIEDCPPDDLASEGGSSCALKVEYHSVVEDGSPIPKQRVHHFCQEGKSKPCTTLPLSQSEMDQSSWSGSSRQQTPEKGDQSAREESFVSVGPNEFRVLSPSPQSCLVSCAPITMSQMVDASSDFRACFTSTRPTQATVSTADGSSNTLPLAAHRDAAVGTDSSPTSHSQDTQTLNVSTAEKYVITEVYMADLDLLTKEFTRLQLVQVELNQLKAKMARSGLRSAGGAGSGGCQGDCGCDCAQRAKRAELRLLALQYGMCQQHCWRRYYTSPQGERVLQGGEALPDSMAETLQILEDDYQKMRRQILSGVPMAKLQPLSVDSQRMTTGTRYSPAQIEEYLEDEVPLGSTEMGSQQLQDEGAPEKGGEGQEEDEEKELPTTKTSTAIQNGPSKEASVTHTKVRSCRSGRAVILGQTGTSCELKPGAPKDHNSSEAWFDAEEDLGSANQSSKVEGHGGLRGGGDHKMEEDGDVGEREKDQSSLLCVTNLPSGVTEGELLLWFEKYQAREVCISTFSNSSGAAVVTVSCPKGAEAAVKELHGNTIQGHTIHVGHIRRPKSPGPSTAHAEGPTGDCPSPSTTGFKKCAPYNTSPKSLRCSLEKLTKVCNSPTASGTCVPQHYATMGSFDTLMIRLSERHPEVGRQRIVNALLELRAKHQGFLSGLPLKAIVDMTSDLLTRPSTTK